MSYSGKLNFLGHFPIRAFPICGNDPNHLHVYWNLEGAELGLPTAIYFLAGAYHEGTHGADKNLDKAKFLYEQGVARGDAASLLGLSQVAEEAAAVEKNAQVRGGGGERERGGDRTSSDILNCAI